jgi:glycosyltransferase involved in cell wall biosynthesis
LIDLLIPVYREGLAVLPVLRHVESKFMAPHRILICYDSDEDPTLEAIRSAAIKSSPLVFVKNEGRGVHGAIVTGFAKSDAEAVIVYPADDDSNGGILDELVRRFRSGAHIVAPSRFMRGGMMVGCRWTKAALVRTAAFILYHLAQLPTHDPTNGFRLFSRRVLREIPIESTEGFAFSIELLVKARRRGWHVEEVPSRWFERKHGKSRFKIVKWLPVYLRWFFYAFSRQPDAALGAVREAS